MGDGKHKSHSGSGDIWIAKESRSRKGKVYYYNKKTGQTTWIKPTSCVIVPDIGGFETKSQTDKTSKTSSLQVTDSSKERNRKEDAKPSRPAKGAAENTRDAQPAKNTAENTRDVQPAKNTAENTRDVQPSKSATENTREILKAKRKSKRPDGSHQSSSKLDGDASKITKQPETTKANAQTGSPSADFRAFTLKLKGFQIPKLSAGNLFGAGDVDGGKTENVSTKSKPSSDSPSLRPSSKDLNSNVPWGKSEAVEEPSRTVFRDKAGQKYGDDLSGRVSPVPNRQNAETKPEWEKARHGPPFLESNSRQTDRVCSMETRSEPPRRFNEVQRRGLAEDRMTKLRRRLSEEVREKMVTKVTSPKLPQDRRKADSPRNEAPQTTTTTRKRAISPKSKTVTAGESTTEEGDIISEDNLEPAKKKKSLNLRLTQASNEVSALEETKENKVLPSILRTAQDEKIVPENTSFGSSGGSYESEAMDIDEQAQLISEEINVFRNSLSNWQTLDKEPEWTPMETDFWVVSAAPQSSILVVLDTNILVSHLDFVKELRDTVKIDGTYPVLYLPWMVIQELDRLKDHGGYRASKPARAAVGFLNDSFKSKHPRLRGQTGREANRSRGASLEERCPDDSILESCLQLKEQGFQIILLSNDINLCTKALMHDIKALNRYQLSNKVERTGEKTSSISQDLLPSTEKQGSVMSRLKQHVRSNEDSDNLKVKQVEAKPVEAKSTGITEHLKEVLLEGLSKIISKGMEAEYGSLWTKRVLYKPPWHLETALMTLAHHWFALCDCNTPESVRNAVNALKRILKKKTEENDGDLKEMRALMSQIFNQLNSKYDDIIKPLELRLQDTHSRSIVNNETSAAVKNDVHFPKSTRGMQNDSLGSDGVSHRSQNLPPSCYLVMTYFQSLWNIVHAFCSVVKGKIESGLALDSDTKTRSQEMLNGIEEITHYMNGILAIPENEIDISHPDVKGLLDILMSVTIPEGTDPLQLQDVFVFCTRPFCRVSLRNGVAQLGECAELLVAAINAGS